MEFSRPEYWSGEPFPSPEDLPNPGIEPRSPALQVDSLPTEPQGKPINWEENQMHISYCKSQYNSHTAVSLCCHFFQGLFLLLFSHLSLPNRLWPHGLQHARLLCPPLSPRVCSNSCPLSQWCYWCLTVSFFGDTFSSFPLSLYFHWNFRVNLVENTSLWFSMYMCFNLLKTC